MKNKNMFCTNCGLEGKPKKETPGSFFIELILWFMMIIPGVVYSLWRIGNKFHVCSGCNSKHLIPADSPIALSHKGRMK